MSWKDRAQPVDGKTSGGWKSRALPVDAASEEPTTSAGMAALEHYGNTALGGHLPQFQAFVEKMLPNPTADVDAELEAQGFKIQGPDDSYVSLRDKNIERLKTEEKEHPWASTAGKGGGLAASMLVPTGAAAKGATLAAKVGRGAVGGAAVGAIQNPGDEEGEISPVQFGDRARGAAIGAAIGGVAPAAIDGASALSNKVSNYLKRKAATLAEKATGATGAASEKFVEGTGRELLDRKIVKFGSSPSNIAENAQSALDAAQKSKMDIIENQLKGTNVDRNKIYNRVREKIQELSKDESQVDLVKKLESNLDDILGVADRTSAELPFAQSEKVRAGFDKAAKWDSNSDAPTREAKKILAGAYREAGEDAANAVSPELGGKFKQEKTLQRMLIPVAESAEKRALQLQQSPHGGLLDITAGGAGGTIGGLIGGPIGAAVGGVTGLGLKALRPRYASMGAVAADKLGGKAAGAAAAASKINPQVAQMIAQRRLRGTGDYKRIDDPILKDQRLMDIFRKDPSLIESIQDEKTKSLVRAELKKRGIASDKGSR